MQLNVHGYVWSGILKKEKHTEMGQTREDLVQLYIYEYNGKTLLVYLFVINVT